MSDGLRPRSQMNYIIIFAFVFCQIIDKITSSNCDISPEFWCNSKETASRCGVLPQCQQYVWTQQDPAKLVDLTLYYESLCPDCRNFWTKQLFPVYQKVGHIMNISLVPFGNARETKNGTLWKFECQHGPKECYGNLIETCAISIVKNISVYLPFIHCIEASSKSIEDAAFMCSKQFPTVPLDQIKTCAADQFGNLLEHDMAIKTGALEPKHTYVPWVTVNGVHTEQMEKMADSNLLKLVCHTYQGPKPSACVSV